MEKISVKTEYQDVALKLIDEPEGRVRLDVDDDEIENLAENIKEVGQIQPIVLAKDGKRFEIIAGHRRFLAISSLGKKTIKAIVKEMARVDIALVRASENLIRTDLSPIEEGAIYVDLAKEHKMSMRQIGDKFGKGASIIKKKMDLLLLDPEIQKAIHRRVISMQVGMVLNQIEEHKERKLRLNDAINNGCTEETALIWLKDAQRSSVVDSSQYERGISLEPNIETTKIYQACELCEEPVEMQKAKMIRICPACYKTIIDNLKPGG